jgi:hypothetical protein
VTVTLTVAYSTSLTASSIRERPRERQMGSLAHSLASARSAVPALALLPELRGAA